MVREHFAKKLRKSNAKGWEEAHGRPYDYYKNLPKEMYPNTLAEMEHLYAAVAHGCLAGQHQKAMEVWQHNPIIYPGICIYTGLCTAYLELGMKREAIESAMEGLKRFPDEDPVLYHNVGATFYEMGWQEEAIEVLKKGAKKFPKDEELKEFLKELEDDMDYSNNGEKPPVLGLILLMALLYKKMRKK